MQCVIVVLISVSVSAICTAQDILAYPKCIATLWLACVAGGISCASAFVLVAKP